MEIQNLKDIEQKFEAILCDVWGVVHNGINAHKNAVDALTRFRQNNKIVILITNAPRPNQNVKMQLEKLNVAQNAYDDIITSGDVARELIEKNKNSVFHLGPERDKQIFNNINVKFEDENNARCIVCTGLFDDENQKPQDYQKMFKEMIQRKCKMICANPDIIVERGDKIIWCAGALAQMFKEMGGEIEIAGKPYAPIYSQAKRKINEIKGENVNENKILAIGDAIATDAKGAQNNQIQFLFHARGIHQNDYDIPDDAKSIEKFIAKLDKKPEFWQKQLCW